MMKKIAIASLLFASSLFASGDYFDEYVKVRYSKPVYESIEVVKPHRHTADCYEERVVRRPSRDRADENSIGLDTIIGVASGVAIGNQIGKGNGRTAAKVIGGILGGTVANKIRNYDHYDDYSYDRHTEKRLICNEREPRTYTKRVLKGYDNYFTYKGREYVKFSKRAKNKVRVTTSISF